MVEIKERSANKTTLPLPVSSTPENVIELSPVLERYVQALEGLAHCAAIRARQIRAGQIDLEQGYPGITREVMGKAGDVQCEANSIPLWLNHKSK